MFSSDNVLVMVLGIFTALGFIIGSTYFVYQMFAKSTKEILVRFILVVFTALVALFIVDKSIAWKVNLIAPEQNEQLFDLIRTLVLMKGDYLVQIYSNPWMPKSFNRNGKKVRLEKISNKFEQMAKYITELDDTFEIKFMDVNFRD